MCVYIFALFYQLVSPGGFFRVNVSNVSNLQFVENKFILLSF